MSSWRGGRTQNAAGLREYRTPRFRASLQAATRGAIQGDRRDQFDVLSQVVEHLESILGGRQVFEDD